MLRLWWWKDPEYVCSEDGTITFNYLQQSVAESDVAPASPIEEGATGTTDPGGITD